MSIHTQPEKAAQASLPLFNDARHLYAWVALLMMFHYFGIKFSTQGKYLSISESCASPIMRASHCLFSSLMLFSLKARA